VEQGSDEEVEFMGGRSTTVHTRMQRIGAAPRMPVPLDAEDDAARRHIFEKDKASPQPMSVEDSGEEEDSEEDEEDEDSEVAEDSEVDEDSVRGQRGGACLHVSCLINRARLLDQIRVELFECLGLREVATHP
jgi:hypothetical protein